MEKDVLIKISGLQVLEDTGDSIEMMSFGKYYTKNEKHYLFYEDIEEETGKKTKNRIKFNDNYVEVMRDGNINGELVFEKGKNYQSLYSTPFGDMLLEVLTKDISLNELDRRIDLKIDYELHANNSKISDSRIEIQINEQ